MNSTTLQLHVWLEIKWHYFQLAGGRAIPLLPLWAVQPVQSLSACTRVHFQLASVLQQVVSANVYVYIHD